jgi:hypothetical protein
MFKNFINKPIIIFEVKNMKVNVKNSHVYVHVFSYPDKYSGAGKIIMNRLGYIVNPCEKFLEVNSYGSKVIRQIYRKEDIDYLIVSKHINGHFYKIVVFKILDIDYDLNKVVKIPMYKYENGKWSNFVSLFLQEAIRKSIRVALDLEEV